MKKIVFNLLAIIAIINFVACDPENVIEGPDVVYSDTLEFAWDTANVVKIDLNNTSISCSSANVSVNGTVATIGAKGSYEISGTLNDGQIIVNSKGLVHLIFNNATISNSTTSPIFIEQAHKTVIILKDGTTNTVSDASSYTLTADSLNAAIYSKDYLSVFGTGKLIVNGNYNMGISGKDELIIKSGNIEVNSVGVGIKGKDYLKIYDANLKVTSGGDALKSDNDSIAEFGYVDIEAGTFNLTSATDGISATKLLNISGGNFTIVSGGGSTVATTTVSTKGVKAQKVNITGGVFSINSSDNCIVASNDIVIDNGTFTLLSANKPIDSDSTITINNGDINITKAEKGISSHNITINGGKVTVVSKNDCLKATLGNNLTVDDGSSVNINGGTILLSTEKGDALDSNGSIKMTAGTLVIQGSQTSPDDAISYRSTCVISGGSMAAVGATSLLPTSSSTQNTVFIKFNSLLIPGIIINIQDASGVSVLTYKTTKYAYCVMFSLPTLAAGTYTVYTGGSTTGSSLNGFYNDGVYSPGVKRGTFTVTAKVTSVTL